MKKLSALLVMASVVLSLAGCGGSKQAEQQPAAVPTEAATQETAKAPDAPKGKSSKPEKESKIALVPKDSTNAWFVRMEEGVKKFAQDTGLNAFQKGPSKTDAAMQVQVVQDLIAQGVDAICVVPVDPAALEPVLGEALQKGIVVVTHEASFQKNTMYDIEAFNNANYGAFIMDNLAKAMGEEGIYTTMVGHVTNASHNEWADGGVAHQKEKYPTSSKDAPGVARAIEELGLKDKKFAAGTGLVSECGQYLKSGTLQFITLWDPKDAGYALCSLAAKILRGEKIENGCNLGLKGYENLQFAKGSDKVLLGSGWIVINKDNMGDYNF